MQPVRVSVRGGFVTRNLPVRHSSRMHLATVPLVSGCARECTTRVACVLFSVAAGGTCDAVTILFSPSFTVLRRPPRKLQPAARPLVTGEQVPTRALALPLSPH